MDKESPLPERRCETCKNYDTDCGEYGVVFTVFCMEGHDEDEEGNPLEGFPFNPAPDCYEPEFWLSDFVQDLDGTEEALNEAHRRFMDFIQKDQPL